MYFVCNTRFYLEEGKIMWISKVSNCEMEACVLEVCTHSLKGDIFKHILKCRKIMLWHS
jgi:hypothetical protein